MVPRTYNFSVLFRSKYVLQCLFDILDSPFRIFQFFLELKITNSKISLLTLKLQIEFTISMYNWMCYINCTYHFCYIFIYTLRKMDIKYEYLLSKSESVKFSLIESVICLFTDSSVKKYFSLLNQLIFTDSSVKKIFFTVKSVNFHLNN